MPVIATNNRAMHKLLDFERTSTFLLFFLVSSSCHGVLFLFVVFFGLSKRIRFFCGVVFLACDRASDHGVSCSVL